MADVKWIKFYIDMFDKKKIKKIRRLPDGDRILLFWVMLLATAGKCNAGGMIYITENVPFDEEDFADEFSFEPNTIRLALDAFVKFDMISISEGGYIFVNGWEEHQSTDRLAEIREYNRIAQQKSRAKRKLLQDVNDNVNDKSMTSQRCHETDIDKDIREDIEVINNIGDNVPQLSPKRSRFTPPSFEEVREYCYERNNGVDAQRFIDYYTSNGWMVGKNKMKDWKAAVRTWEKNGVSKPKNDTDRFMDELKAMYQC